MAESVLSSKPETSDVNRNEEFYKEIVELPIHDRKNKLPRCEICVSERLSRESVAVFLCFKCEVYVCVECLTKHESHEGMKVERERWRNQRDESKKTAVHIEKKENTGFLGMLKTIANKVGRTGIMKENESEESEKWKEQLALEPVRDQESLREQSVTEEKERKYMLELFIDRLVKESDVERKQKLKNSHAVIYDRVKVKHELDNKKKDCDIRGICGLENKHWVVCDSSNCCIKIFKLGSHALQRYIRFAKFGPGGVTEIVFKQNYTESNLASGSNSDIFEAGRAKTDKKCLIAVTIPGKRQIIFIDLDEKPALPNKVIKTEERCFSIQFHDDKIFTVCSGVLDSPRSVYIKSLEGDTLKMFYIGIYGRYLAVISRKVYVTDRYNDRVQSINRYGHGISTIRIKGSWPKGISVDPDNNVYVCAGGHNTIYKLDSNLNECKSVLDQTTDYVESPRALCFYRDKLFIGHDDPPSLKNFVTVVRLV